MPQAAKGPKSNDAVPSTLSKRKRKAVIGTQYSNQNSRCKEKRHDRGTPRFKRALLDCESRGAINDVEPLAVKAWKWDVHMAKFLKSRVALNIVAVPNAPGGVLTPENPRMPGEGE